MRFDGRFPDCMDCANFNPSKIKAKCFNCGAGEFFEEIIDDGEGRTDSDMFEEVRQMEREFRRDER